MNFSIASKVALITGGAGGLGFCIAKTLLKQGLKGVSLIDVREDIGVEAQNTLRKEFGPNSCIFIKADVAQQFQLEEAFKQTVDSFKQLDIVVNNAGIISEQNWQKCLDVNLRGCIVGTKLAIDEYLPKHKNGHEAVLVNVSSILGLETVGGVPIYTATKHGVVALSRAFGVKEHYERTKVRVVAICPGHMATPLILKPQTENFVPEYRKYFKINQDNYPVQSPEFVAESILNIIKKGPNGSVWVIEDTKPAYEVEFRDRFGMRKN